MTDYQELRLNNNRSVEQQQADFWRFVDQPQTGCWNWQRGQLSSGYGQVRYCGKVWRAHRLAWTLAVGDIPIGLNVLHTCDNPLCCNLVHLWLGTDADNAGDAAAKGRMRSRYRDVTHCKWGHEFNAENTYYKPDGNRQCRACVKERRRKRHEH